MEILHVLAQRPVIAALAILGALLVMAASLIGGSRGGAAGGPGRLLSLAGYAVTFASIALFIAAGFLSGR